MAGVGLGLLAAVQLSYYGGSGVLTDGLLPLASAYGAAAGVAIAVVAGALRRTALMAVLLAVSILVGVVTLGSLLLVSPVTALWLPASLAGGACLAAPRREARAGAVDAPVRAK